MLKISAKCLLFYFCISDIIYTAKCLIGSEIMKNNLGSRVRRLRKERNLSGIKVAEKLDITPQYYYDIEKGERRLTTEIASKLADILETTTDYLLGKTDINLYDWIPYEEDSQVSETKDSPSYTTEKEPEIPIEELVSHQLTYKGHVLTEEQKKHLVKLLQAAADMLEK